PVIGVVPFISQIAGNPSLFCHRISALPSLLKSPVVMACHEGPGAACTAPFIITDAFIIDVPFISQIAGTPSAFCHRMSALPSLLNSPVAMACQDGPGFASTAAVMIDAPFISQIAGKPSAFCNKMSLLPSLLKSPVALTCHEAPGLGRPCD